ESVPTRNNRLVGVVSVQMQATTNEDFRKDVAGGRDSLPSRPSNADRESTPHCRLLPGIRSRNVTFQFLNGLRLARDYPLHKVANRYDAYRFVILQNWQVPKPMVGHDSHALVHRVPRTYEDYRAGHNLADPRLLGGMPHQDHLRSTDNTSFSSLLLRSISMVSESFIAPSLSHLPVRGSQTGLP